MQSSRRHYRSASPSTLTRPTAYAKQSIIARWQDSNATNTLTTRRSKKQPHSRGLQQGGSPHRGQQLIRIPCSSRILCRHHVRYRQHLRQCLTQRAHAAPAHACPSSPSKDKRPHLRQRSQQQTTSNGTIHGRSSLHGPSSARNGTIHGRSSLHGPSSARKGTIYGRSSLRKPSSASCS
jgi:hypothetical protein